MTTLDITESKEQNYFIEGREQSYVVDHSTIPFYSSGWRREGP